MSSKIKSDVFLCKWLLLFKNFTHEHCNWMWVLQLNICLYRNVCKVTKDGAFQCSTIDRVLGKNPYKMSLHNWDPNAPPHIKDKVSSQRTNYSQKNTFSQDRSWTRDIEHYIHLRTNYKSLQIQMAYTIEAHGKLLIRWLNLH